MEAVNKIVNDSCFFYSCIKPDPSCYSILIKGFVVFFKWKLNVDGNNWESRIRHNRDFVTVRQFINKRILGFLKWKLNIDGNNWSHELDITEILWLFALVVNCHRFTGSDVPWDASV